MGLTDWTQDLQDIFNIQEHQTEYVRICQQPLKAYI